MKEMVLIMSSGLKLSLVGREDQDTYLPYRPAHMLTPGLWNV